MGLLVHEKMNKYLDEAFKTIVNYLLMNLFLKISIIDTSIPNIKLKNYLFHKYN